MEIGPVAAGQDIQYRVVPPVVAGAVLARHIVRDAGAWALQRVRRDRGRVAAEYHDGSWKRALDARRWLRSASIDDYLLPDDDSPRFAKIEHRIVQIGTRDYYRYRYAAVERILAMYAEGEPELVELGCGTGMNLLALARGGAWPSLSGFDISENALTVARESARHFGLEQISFGRLDLTDAVDPAYEKVRGRTVFTYLCLEQLRYATPGILESLILHGVRRVIHFEASLELLDRWSLQSVANRVHIRRRDYQSNLLQPLHALERQGRVRMIAAWRPGYAPAPKHDPLVAVWEPAGQE